MTLLVALFAGSALCDVLLWAPIGGRVRKVIAMVDLIALAFASGVLATWRPNIASILFCVVSLYRLFNCVRVLEGRVQEGYLRRTIRRTALHLLGFQLIVAALWWLWAHQHASARLAWSALAACQLAVAAVLLISTMRRLRRTAWPRRLPHLSDAELPTVTVAVPARNETEDLETCLESLIASDYPKLEIVVLDDCSQSKRTPEIIRSFAHAGVRFVQGEPPSDTWLPKNRAYAQLVREASGEYILFCGVDVHLTPGSIRQLVVALTSKKKSMMSILPRRSLQTHGRLALAQAMRYWWELVPPRRLFHRPPVLSSCWIIATAALKAEGGFAAVSRSVVPEAYFARQLLRRDAYSFMRSGLSLGITSNKSATEQRATAIRLRYPQLHRRPENVCALSLLQTVFLVLPFALTMFGCALHIGTLAGGMAAAASLLLIVTCVLLARTTRVIPWELSVVAVPIMALYDLALVHYSMWRYEFASVDWKGRNICIPAMHVVPHLPPLPPSRDATLN